MICWGALYNKLTCCDSEEWFSYKILRSRPRGVKLFVCTSACLFVSGVCVCMENNAECLITRPWGVFLTLFLAQNTLTIGDNSAHLVCTTGTRLLRGCDTLTKCLDAAIRFHSVWPHWYAIWPWNKYLSSPPERRSRGKRVWPKQQTKTMCFFHTLQIEFYRDALAQLNSTAARFLGICASGETSKDAREKKGLIMPDSNLLFWVFLSCRNNKAVSESVERAASCAAPELRSRALWQPRRRQSITISCDANKDKCAG